MRAGVAYAKLGNQFVHGAIGIHADIVFVDTAAAKQRGRALITSAGIDTVHLCYLAERKHFDQLTGIGAKRADLRHSGGNMTTDQRPILGQLGVG